MSLFFRRQRTDASADHQIFVMKKVNFWHAVRVSILAPIDRIPTDQEPRKVPQLFEVQEIVRELGPIFRI